MNRNRTVAISILFGLLLGFVAARFADDGMQAAYAEKSPAAEARVAPKSAVPGQAQTSSTKALANRDVYYPGTEELDPDEIRLIAAGTGMPGARRGQAATCFLIELGNTGHEQEAMLLCCCYIDGLAGHLYWPDPASHQNFVRAFRDFSPHEFLSRIHPKQLYDAIAGLPGKRAQEATSA